MPNIFDSCKFILDVIGTLGVPTGLTSAELNEKESHCIVNYLPQNRGDLLSTNIINVNLYIKKLNSQHDIATIETQYELIQSRLETYSGLILAGDFDESQFEDFDSTELGILAKRLGYSAIQLLSEPFLGDLEGTDFSILNTRITLTNNI